MTEELQTRVAALMEKLKAERNPLLVRFDEEWNKDGYEPVAEYLASLTDDEFKTLLPLLSDAQAASVLALLSEAQVAYILPLLTDARIDKICTAMGV